MRLLELFSGTGSVGRAFASAGWDVVSLDSDPQSPASIHADIRHFDFRVWQPGDFDAIWASPPCTEYSIARTRAKRPRDLDGADALVLRALHVIEYLRPVCYWIENPWTGLLRKRQVVAGLPMHITDYCRWGAPYKKRTALWTNHPSPDLLLCDKACGSFAHGRHVASAQRGPSCSGASDTFSVHELHALPARLCDHIASKTSAFVSLASSAPV
jgi:hypothetical protein